MTSKQDTSALTEAVRLLRNAGHAEAASDLALSVLENAAEKTTDAPAPSSDTKGESEGEMLLRLVGELPGRTGLSIPFDERGQS